MRKCSIAFFCLQILSGAAAASGVYQTPEAFLAETFGGTVPKPQSYWFGKADTEAVERILQRKSGALRTRYWRSGGRSAWILEETGKEQPITVGIVINHGRIERIRVLIFRESRGWEVRQSFFTDQFVDAGLQADLNLDKPIDGITGATLSVNALIKLARLALYLHGRMEAPST